MTTLIASEYDAESFNLTSKEFENIQEILGRRPNIVELEFFSILWSEHASYKHSNHWLQILPKKSDKVIVEAGEESSGVIDIGNGLVCSFKVESHNHPCAIQPRLGASTGLRVVTRDIFTMGAKPLAFLNSLRFGNDERETAKWLFHEVIKGFSDFENSFEVPVVGGELFFADGFNSAPVVNNMVVGVTKKENIISAVAKGSGNIVVVVGVPTGSEGVEGDPFSVGIYNDKETSHVLNSYLRSVELEKALYQLIQELIDSKLTIGIQGVGGQGIVGAVVEMVRRGKSGIKLSTENIPTEIEGMSSRDVLVSETWGRILLCISPEKGDLIKEIVEKYELSYGVLGEVTEDKLFSLYENDKLLAELPVDYLGFGGKTPTYKPEFKLPEIDKSKDIEVESVQEPDHYPATVRSLLESYNLVSKKWIQEQYSPELRSQDLSLRYPSDASLIEIEPKGKALAATMDCNPGYMTVDPYVGAQIAVAEAARNIVCAGATPLAVSDCLNFGNPKDPKAYGDFVASIKGIAKACEFFDVPVISGNVSFYNHRSKDGEILPITPSPIIGMVGVLNDSSMHTTLSFRHKGDMIFLIGKSRNDINGSEYIRKVYDINESIPPYYDAEEERQLQDIISKVINEKLVRSVHDVSNGGLFFTLLECAVPLEFGFDVTTDAEIRKDAFLFGESQSRVVVSVSAEKETAFIDYMIEQKHPFSILGHVTKGEIRIDDESYGYVADIKKTFESKMKNWVEEI